MTQARSKTVRFAQVVSHSGKPEVITLWGEPGPDFLKAIQQERVMSIRQETVGARSDFGEVGFVRKRNMSYLLFPRSLKPFQGQRIIGIKYDLIEGGRGQERYSSIPRGRRRMKSPATREDKPRSTPASMPPSHGPKPPKRPQAPRTMPFRVVVHYQVEAEVSTVVQASSRKTAQEAALRTVRAPDFSRISPRRRVLKVTKA